MKTTMEDRHNMNTTMEDRHNYVMNTTMEDRHNYVDGNSWKLIKAKVCPIHNIHC